MGEPYKGEYKRKFIQAKARIAELEAEVDALKTSRREIADNLTDQATKLAEKCRDNNQLRAKCEALSQFVVHDIGCLWARRKGLEPCTCGLTALLNADSAEEG